MFENERWVPIDEFPHYYVSDHGRVRHVNSVQPRKLTVNERGFVVIQLLSSGGVTRFLRQVNQLVAEAFLPPPEYEDETSVWHLDGILTNCKFDNLKWATRSDVLEWNRMHKQGAKFSTPRVKNNETGEIYQDAYACAMSEGILESSVLWHIERLASHMEDDSAKYRYVFGEA